MSTTAIKPRSGKGLDIKVYPNPVINELNVNLNAVTAGQYQLTVFDVTGKMTEINLLKTIAIGSQNFVIPTETFAKGNYILKIIDPKGAKTEVKFNKN